MKGKLFLSGGGDEKQTYKLDEIFLKNLKKIIYIPIAWPNNDFSRCLKWFKNMLNTHNKHLEIKMITDLNKGVNLEEYDALYIGGGNTFKLLKRIKDSKFDKKLLDYYNNEGIIYGGSAGAIIFGNNIKTASLCKDSDVNKVKLKDLKGLNLINNFDIQCHFEDNQIKEHQDFIKKTKRNVIAIPEESALLIKQGEYHIIGLKPITLIKKTKIIKYKVGKIKKLK